MNGFGHITCSDTASSNRFQSFSLNLHGELVEFHHPAIMGIINVTPDSFHAASRITDDDSLARTAERMAAEGADILDIGACSTRPGFTPPPTEDETERVCHAIEVVRRVCGRIPLSVDTFRASVAREAYNHGADIINDVSGLNADTDMITLLEEIKAPYILTDGGVSATLPPEETAVAVCRNLQEKVRMLTLKGICDIIIDPGFCFGKTIWQNYALMDDLSLLSVIDRPILVGISRKSMIYKLLNCTSEEALNGTTALNMMALQRGASILRVHDATAAAECRKIFEALKYRIPSKNSRT